MKNILIVIFFTSCSLTGSLFLDLNTAKNHVEEGKYQKAIDVYEKILERNPPNNIKINILFLLADLKKIYIGDIESGVSYLEEAFELTENPVEQLKAIIQKADLHYSYLKEYDKAETIYKDLVNVVPPLKNKQEFFTRYSMCLFHQAKYKEAIEVFKKMIKFDGENSLNARLYIALSRFHMKDYQNAETEIEDYLKKERNEKKRTTGKYILGNILETNEKLDKAYKVYYSILGKFSNTSLIKSRLESIYQRKLARKR